MPALAAVVAGRTLAGHDAVPHGYELVGDTGPGPGSTTPAPGPGLSRESLQHRYGPSLHVPSLARCAHSSLYFTGGDSFHHLLVEDTLLDESGWHATPAG